MPRLALVAVLLAGGCVRAGFDLEATTGAEGTGALDALVLVDHPLTSDLPLPSDGPAASDAPWPGFTLHDFQAYWSTAGTIAWVWQCSGALPAFDRFEVCVDTDPAKVAAGGGTCLGPQDSFALGTFDCLGPPWWQMAISYGLQPSTTYHAKLHVWDQGGAHHGSPPATLATTAVPPAQTVVFTDTIPSGVWVSELSLSGANPHSGSAGLVATVPDEQWLNLHYGGMTLAFPGLTDNRLKEGYLELYLDTPTATQVCMVLQQGSDIADHCPPDYFAAPDGKPGYQRIQIPLSQLISRKTNKPITAAALAAIDKIMPGAAWGQGTVYIDDIVFRY